MISVTGWREQAAQVGAAGVVGVVGDRRQRSALAAARRRRRLAALAHRRAAYMQARLQLQGRPGRRVAASRPPEAASRCGKRRPRGARVASPSDGSVPIRSQ